MGCSPSRSSVVNMEIMALKTQEYLCRSTEVKHSLGLLVEVKGFCDAVVSLCGPQEMTDYEVTIGAQSNAHCLLRSTRDRDLAARCDSLGILDQAGYRSFWLTWRPGQLCLGKGYRPGQQELLSIPTVEWDVAPSAAVGAVAGYRPYCVKVACPTAGSRVSFRDPRLLFDGDF